jgi:hypothetical protein
VKFVLTIPELEIFDFTLTRGAYSNASAMDLPPPDIANRVKFTSQLKTNFDDQDSTDSNTADTASLYSADEFVAQSPVSTLEQPWSPESPRYDFDIQSMNYLPLDTISSPVFSMPELTFGKLLRLSVVISI